MIKNLKITVVNIDNSSYPCYVTCKFIDINKKTITIVEKMDVLTSNSNKIKLNLSEYLLKCKILEEKNFGYMIDLSEPYGVLDTNNNCIFFVGKDLISDKHFDD